MQRLSPRFRSQQFFLSKIRGKMFHSNFERFVWRRHADAHLWRRHDGHRHETNRKPTETSVTEFCCKIVNLSLEELTNIKIILFLIQEPFRKLNSPKLFSLFFNQHDSSIGRHASYFLDETPPVLILNLICPYGVN